MWQIAREYSRSKGNFSGSSGCSRLANPEAAEQAFYGDCQGRVVNWIGSQSVPEPLPPFTAGAARSELLKLLEEGHQGTKLSREELEKIACWIDLLVPYCGDYLEANAWTDEELKKYQRYVAKRRQMEELQQENLRDLTRSSQRMPDAAGIFPERIK